MMKLICLLIHGGHLGFGRHLEFGGHFVLLGLWSENVQRLKLYPFANFHIFPMKLCDEIDLFINSRRPSWIWPPSWIWRPFCFILNGRKMVSASNCTRLPIFIFFHIVKLNDEIDLFIHSRFKVCRKTSLNLFVVCVAIIYKSCTNMVPVFELAKLSPLTLCVIFSIDFVIFFIDFVCIILH